MCLLEHPNIIGYIDSFEDNKNSHIVIEYACGCDIQVLIENATVDELASVRILYQLLLALKTIHSKNIAHKSVKPGDILLDMEENAKIADFGIAKF